MIFKPSAVRHAGPCPCLKALEGGLSYVDAVLWLGARLADGLAHAHERGILHRDLKPANVLLTDDGQPMLLDFNLSEDTKLRSGAARRSSAARCRTWPRSSWRPSAARAACADARGDLYSPRRHPLRAADRPAPVPAPRAACWRRCCRA